MTQPSFAKHNKTKGRGWVSLVAVMIVVFLVIALFRDNSYQSVTLLRSSDVEFVPSAIKNSEGIIAGGLLSDYSAERSLIGTGSSSQQPHDVIGADAVVSVVEKSFLEVGKQTSTDKVAAMGHLPACLEKDASCTRPSCTRKECRPWGHFYHTMYQQKFGKYTLPTTEPFQFLEIGFFKGSGYDAYSKFFEDVPGAELHSMEISCLPEGPQGEGKWPWGNFAKENKNYEALLKKDLLHCGDASKVSWLDEIYTHNMRRAGAPPLKIVVDDGAHIAMHMVTSVFFWFPRIEPGGFLVVEDIQPIEEANLFRTQFLPQIMMDLHFCGDPKQPKDEACFPTLWPLLQSIHCEMHICVFERNQEPAIPDLSLELSSPPPNALDLTKCYSFAKSFGRATG